MTLASRVFGGLLLGSFIFAPPVHAQEPPAPSVRLSVHARSTRSAARREQVAWVGLSVPLGAAAAASAPQSAAAPSTSSPPPPEPWLSLPRLRALADFARRAAVVAIAHAGMPEEQRRVQALASRSRWAALLPELELRAQRNSDQALRWAPTTDDPYRVTQADEAGTVLEARATFNLDRLLFTREELSVEALRERAGSERLKLQGRVLSALLALFRARELSCSELSPAARLEQLLRAAEQLTELDVLTAGWFAAHALSFSHAVWGYSEALLGQCSPPAAAPAPTPTKAVATPAASG